MRLLLIRHGLTSSNVGHNLDTAVPGADLNDHGRRQAAALPAALADEHIDAIYASTLVRSQQTAAPLAHALGLPMQVRDGIREISAGDLEMRSDDESIEQYVAVVFGWAQDLDARLPGGESGREVMARFDAVVQEAVDSGAGTVVFVSHGAMIRVWVGLRSTNADSGFTLRNWLMNTGMVVVEGSPLEGWTVQQWREHPLGGTDLAYPTLTGPAGEPGGLHQA